MIRVVLAGGADRAGNVLTWGSSVVVIEGSCRADGASSTGIWGIL